MSIKNMIIKWGINYIIKKGENKIMWQAIRELIRVSVAGGIAAGSAYATNNKDDLGFFMIIIPPLLRALSKWLSKKYPGKFDWLPF